MTPEPALPSLPAAGTDLTSAPARSKKKKMQVEDLLARWWGRLLVPSLTDLLFVALMAWMFMSTGKHGWQSLLADGDVGWHIRTGEYIADHHAVPHHDLFSFSKPGAPWYAWEWLADLIDAGLHRMAGLKGIVLAAGIIIVVFAISLLRRMIIAGAHPFAALLVSLLGVGAASIHFLARPHIYTLLLLSVSLGVLEADRRERTSRVWWLVPMAAVWTNLHGGFLVLVLVLGLAAVGAAVEALLEKTGGWSSVNWSPALRYAALAMACAAVSLVNPYGWGLHKHVIEYLRSDWIRNVVQEFQSPNFRGEPMMQFETLLFLGLITVSAMLRRRRIVEALWIFGFAYLALSSARHVPIFITVVSPLLALELTGWWRQWTAAAAPKSIPGILNQISGELTPGFRRSSILPVVFVAWIAFIGSPVPWPTDFPAEMFPIEMIHAHETQIRSARLITTDQWADYLIYLHPDQKVFVDGRSDFYGPEVGNQFLHVMNGAPDWDQVMKKYQFDLALLPVECALSQMLKRDSQWKVVADDGKHIILSRRSELLSERPLDRRRSTVLLPGS